MRRRRSSVRLRLTTLYGLLFLASGALLLGIAGTATFSSTAQSVRAPAGPPPSPALSRAEAQIRELQVQLAAARQAHAAISHTLIATSGIALGVMGALSIGLGWLMAGRALRPVREMTAAAQRISEYNLSERLAVPGPQDELKELGDTIDGLLARLETAFSAQRRFVANASHELRTPLATMRASIDVALAKPEPAPPATVVLAGRLHAELDRIDQLLEAFLVLARAQHHDLPGRTVLPLDYVLSTALAGQANVIAAKRLTVRDSSDPAGTWVSGSQALLGRLVDNVIDNAIRHNEDGGWISIATTAEDRLACLMVENGGPVLDSKQAAGLAQPFRRFGAERTGTDQGSGLGLSIVAAIADAHGGSLELVARADGGLRVSVRLPAAAAAAIPAGSRS